jgi:hypothetical protein
MYYIKDRGFRKMDLWFLKEGFEVESFFRPPITKFEGRQDGVLS